MKFTYEADPDVQGSHDEAQKVVESADSIEELVFNWLSPTRSVTLCPCADEETEELEGAFIILVENDDEIGYSVMATGDVKAAYPHLEPISTVDEMDEDGMEKWFNKRDERVMLNEEHPSEFSVTTKKGALEIALQYAISMVGEANFSYSDFHEELELEPFIVLNTVFSSSEEGEGFGEQIVVKS